MNDICSETRADGNGIATDFVIVISLNPLSPKLCLLPIFLQPLKLNVIEPDYASIRSINEFIVDVAKENHCGATIHTHRVASSHKAEVMQQYIYNMTCIWKLKHIYITAAWSRAAVEATLSFVTENIEDLYEILPHDTTEQLITRC